MTPAEFVPRLRLRRALGVAFAVLCVLLTLGAVGVLGALVWRIVSIGGPLLTAEFLTNPPSRLSPQSAGIYTAIWGTLWVIGLTILVTVPVSVAAAIYLQEFAPDNRFTRFIHLNVSNLAGVPSIVYGLLGLAIFVRWWQLGDSVISGALTLSTLVMPVVIIATREALSAVPSSIREAAIALGATRWQAVRHHVAPAALPGVLTGVILAVSRAAGETAPLIIIGAGAFVRFVPGDVGEEFPVSIAGFLSWLHAAFLSRFTVLPIQVYDFSQQPQPAFQNLAAAAIIVLLVTLLTLNSVAIGLRAWHQRKKTW